ncbi:MAG: phosphatidate cytidylyltransferase [Planctomycetes bacterium]|nr:phosphatidate cytidylyltransferase [Planctomycetota bacterium]
MTTQPLTRITIGAGLIAGTAAVLLADVAIAGWSGLPIAPGFWILLAGSLLVGCREFFRMLRGRGYPCRPVIGMAFVGLLLAIAWIEIHRPWNILPWLYGRGLELYLLLIVALVFTTFLVEILSIERANRDVSQALASVGWTVLVVLTVGLLGVFLAKVRFLSPDPFEGLMYLALTLGVVKASDIGAYAIGSTLGRHRLVPKLSPKKTVEGVAGAMAVGVAMAVSIGCGWGRFTWQEMIVFGLAVSISGVLGDLAESLMKRACGVKDSGRIPTFGGALDILDSMLSASPVAYLVLVVLTGPVPMG